MILPSQYLAILVVSFAAQLIVIVLHLLLRFNCTKISFCLALGLWGQWDSCSVTCGGGEEIRSRQCQGGITCSGVTEQKRVCNTDLCTEGEMINLYKNKLCYI